MIVVLKINSSTGITELTITADKSVTIGRSSKSDHIIGDVMLSGAHCKFTLKPPILEIKDLESKNGTFLNGLKIDQSEVYAGDEIFVGNTKITVCLEKMDENSARAMHFPGEKKDRVAHGLKLDVDNSFHLDKLKKEQGFKKPSQMEKSLMAKKVTSKVKPTKQEVKRMHKGKASFANTLDIVLFFAVMALPLIFTNALYFINPQLVKSQRLIVLLCSEVGTVGLFYFLNYKFMKYTLGEKISGIAALCEDQED